MSETLTREDLTTIDDVRREPLEVWGRTVWVWGLTFGQFLALHREAQRLDPDGALRFDPERYALCRVIECVRDSAEVGARPVLNRKEHYDWLRGRSVDAVDRILRLSMLLSGELGGEGVVGADPFASGTPNDFERASTGSV